MINDEQNEILTLLRDKTSPFVCCIIGESGAGKKYIVNKYLQSKEFTGLILKKPEGGVIAPYAPFYNAVGDELFFGVKGVGDQLINSIKPLNFVKKIVASFKSNYLFKYTEHEQLIISQLKWFIDNNNIDLIFCQDIDTWDTDSKILLEKICTYQNSNIIDNPIISTSNDANCTLCKDSQVVKLRNMSFNNFEHELKRLSGRNFTNTEIDSLYSLTNKGNTTLVLYEIEAIKSDFSFDYSDSLYEIITKNVIKLVGPDKGDRILEFVKQASLLGYSMLKTLLIGYTELSNNDFYIFMDALNKLNYMLLSDGIVEFNSAMIYKLICSESYKDIAYKNKLADFIRRIFPADYEYISYLYNNVGDAYLSALFRSLFIIKYVRNKQTKLDVKYRNVDLLERFNLKICVYAIENAYMKFYEGAWKETRLILSSFTCQESIIEFERIYLLSLSQFNDNINYDTADDLIIDLLPYLESEEFRNLFVEAWLRCAMLVLGIRIERKQINEAEKLYILINKTFLKLRLSSIMDLNLEELYFHFIETSATFMKKIDTAKNDIINAFHYYESTLDKCCNFPHYFTALVNYTSVCLLTYDYQTIDCLYNKALLLKETGIPISDDNLICLKNNYIISKTLQTNYETNTLIDAKNTFRQLLQNNTNQVVDVLLKINLYNIYFILHEREWESISELYKAINEDTEDYYKYYICSNYAVMLYYDGKIELANTVFNEVSNILPNIRDQIYFKKRNEYIYKLLQNNSLHINQFINEINLSTPPGIGWSFWGKLLLFSELEQWSY